MGSRKLKPLRLAYELAWRTERDEEFMRSNAWKQLRAVILKRDDSTCSYCNFRAEKGMHVNHMDGNPKNNDHSNLEVVCPECHMIMHSGLWAVVKRVIIVFRKSRYTQNEIVIMTRQMRLVETKDEEIIQHLGLEERVPWKQDLTYLAPLFGFISSSSQPSSQRPFSKPHLTEEQQMKSLANRSNW